MGRQLFYIAAASYITIYLAVVFLIIANTIIGVQFLTWQQKTSRRYKTLVRLEPRMKHYAIRPENKLIGISASPQLLRQLAVFSVFGPCLAAYYPQGLKVIFLQ